MNTIHYAGTFGSAARIGASVFHNTPVTVPPAARINKVVQILDPTKRRSVIMDSSVISHALTGAPTRVECHPLLKRSEYHRVLQLRLPSTKGVSVHARRARAPTPRITDERNHFELVPRGMEEIRSLQRPLASKRVLVLPAIQYHRLHCARSSLQGFERLRNSCDHLLPR